MSTIKSPVVMLIFLFISYAVVCSQEKKANDMFPEKGKPPECTTGLKTSTVVKIPAEISLRNYLYPKITHLPELQDMVAGKSESFLNKSNPLIDDNLTTLTEMQSHRQAKISDSFRFRWVVENGPPEYVTRNYFFTHGVTPKSNLSGKEWYRTSGFIFNEVIRTKYPRLPTPVQ